jgi:hypothetical protein
VNPGSPGGASCTVGAGDKGQLPIDITQAVRNNASVNEKHISKVAATLGRLGGSVKSKAKAEAARENGKLGGRPRKKVKVKR